MVTTPSTTARPSQTSHRAAILSTLRLLEPACVPGMAKCRVGAPADGGYVMLDDLDGISVCYSLGIGKDVSWDLAMARRGALIRQYDHTVSRPPVAHPLFRHRRIGISYDDARRPHMRRLDSLMHENGDAGRHDMILKVDIEGHEWGALGVLGLNDLGCFRQIIVEFHGLGLMALPSFRQRAHDVFARLCASHAVVHVHGNNFAGMQDAAGIKLPDCIEVTFANRGRYRFAPAADTFPGPLDAANDKGLPDLSLGSFKAADFKVGSAPDTASSIFEIVAERATGSSHEVLALPAHVLAAVREELSALARLHRPERPPHDTYRLGPALLDEATAVCARHGIRLDDPVVDGLGQAIRYLRKCLGDLS